MNSFKTRIRGRIAQFDDGKFYFEISLWEENGVDFVGSLGVGGPLDTWELAKAECAFMIQETAEKIAELAGAEMQPTYTDNNDGGREKTWAPIQ